jgi:vacuolar-type H+-ATPase subunit E/Vma4
LAEKDSVDKICEQIKEDGAREINSIIEKAQGTASEIMMKAEEEAKGVGERIVEDAAEKGALAKKRMLSSVSLEVKRIRLRAREEAVTAVMERARLEIDAARQRGDYAKVLAGLAAEAIRVLEGEAFLLYADRRDGAILESAVFPAVRELLKTEGRVVKSIQARDLSGATAGGVQVGVPGGNVIFDNTFESRLYRFRDDIRAIIFEEVFSMEDRIE